MTVLASGSRGNCTVVASARTRVLVDAGLSCRELLRRLAAAGEDAATLDAILVTHEHIDHVAGLAVLARRLNIPVFFTEPTHRAWIRMLTPRTTMTYAKWLEHIQREKQSRAEAVAVSQAASPDAIFATPEATTNAATPSATATPPRPTPAPPPPNVSATDLAAMQAIANLSAAAAPFDPTLHPGPRNPHADPPPEPVLEADEESCEPEETRSRVKVDPTYLPAVEYFRAGTNFAIGDLEITPFTIPHDAADPCGFVIESRSESIRMAIATDLGYVPPNVKAALQSIDVLLLESNHDLEMLRDGPYPWSVKQRVMSRVGHLSNRATGEFLAHDYDGGAAYIVLGHLSESNNAPELARLSAEQAIGDRMTLLGNRILLAHQTTPMDPITL